MGKKNIGKTIYHSTLSNKAHLSNLGKAAGMPGLEKRYKDLDDMISSDPGRKLPFWVREVEKPTVEIDWDTLQNFPSMFQTCFSPEVYGKEEYFQLCENQKKYNIEWMKSKVPGHSIQDNAIANASNWLWKGFEIPWTGPKWETDPLHQVYYTPKEFGVPRYEGSPDQNARLIRVAARVFGSPDVGFGVMAGLGEYSRMGQLISPFFGSMFRTSLLTVTDLPLAETKPIDAGMLKFCKTCKKCARTCPSGAITHKDEPFWGGDDPWHNKGIKGYYIQGRLCFTQMFKYPTNCGICQTVCPFNKLDKAFIHKLIKISIKYLPIFNKFIAEMDDLFGYGLENTETSLLWARDPQEIPLYGLDRSRS